MSQEVITILELVDANCNIMSVPDVYQEQQADSCNYHKIEINISQIAQYSRMPTFSFTPIFLSFLFPLFKTYIII